jgi:hypothetical protein
MRAANPRETRLADAHVRLEMKMKKIILSILITGMICLPVGAYIGAKFLAKGDVRPLINMMALTESFELSRSALLLEGLNKGKTQKVIDILYVDVKGKLNLNRVYDDYVLDDNTVKAIRNNRQQAEDILKRYPNPKFSDCK